MADDNLTNNLAILLSAAGGSGIHGAIMPAEGATRLSTALAEGGLSGLGALSGSVLGKGISSALLAKLFPGGGPGADMMDGMAAMAGQGGGLVGGAMLGRELASAMAPEPDVELPPEIAEMAAASGMSTDDFIRMYAEQRGAEGPGVAKHLLAAMSQYKQAADDSIEGPMGSNMSTAGRFLLAGLLGGGAVAGGVELVALLNRMAAERAAAEQDADVTKDTLTIVLPRDRIKSAACGSVCKTEGTETSERPALRAGQMVHSDGKFGVKVSKCMDKSAAWPTMVASLLAGGAGVVGGYALLRKLVEMRREAALKAELEAAQTEYADALMPGAAEVKLAAADSFSTMDYPMGLAALSLILGAGSTAWITKRVLDEYARSNDDARKGPKEPPEIKRIILRAESEDGDSEKSAEARDTVLAALSVMVDVVSGDPSLARAGVPMANEMYKLAYSEPGVQAPREETDFDRLMTILSDPANKHVRDAAKGAFIDRYHPMLSMSLFGMQPGKWLANNMPGLSTYTDNKMYKHLGDMLRPPDELVPGVDYAEEVARPAAAFNPYKQASSVPALMAGMAIGRSSEKGSKEDDDILDEEKPPPRSRKGRSLEIDADGEDAEEFLDSNRERVVEIVKQLMREGVL
jgi:hypothetical protein